MPERVEPSMLTPLMMTRAMKATNSTYSTELAAVSSFKMAFIVSKMISSIHAV